MAESGGMGGMMPWAELLGALDLNAQGRDVFQKTSKNLQDALGPNNGSAQRVNTGNGGGAADNSGLFEALISMGNKKKEQNPEYFTDLNIEKAKLNNYGGSNFGADQLPKKNYGLRLSSDSTYGL